MSIVKQDDELLVYDLTVATVCFNAISTLPRCIQSVQPLYQSGLKVEHLFIDGASIDGTVAYLEEQLAQGKITRFISEPDNGLYDAMNKAISIARGRIIIFINADDEICASSVVDCCMPILTGAADAVAAMAEIVSPQGKRKSIQYPNLKKAMLMSICCHQSYYCSTETLRALGGFNWQEFPLLADAELMGRMCSSEYISITSNHIASRFYIGGKSSNHLSTNENLRLLLHFKNQILSRIHENDFALALFKQIIKCMTYLVYEKDDDAAAWSRIFKMIEPLLKDAISELTKKTLFDICRVLRKKMLIYSILGYIIYNKKKKVNAFVCKELLLYIKNIRGLLKSRSEFTI